MAGKKRFQIARAICRALEIGCSGAAAITAATGVGLPISLALGGVALGAGAADLGMKIAGDAMEKRDEKKKEAEAKTVPQKPQVAAARIPGGPAKEETARPRIEPLTAAKTPAPVMTLGRQPTGPAQ